MEKRWCTACGEAFEPRPQSPRQAYCQKEECQQARKRLWQRSKRSTDLGHQQNQVKAQERWRRDHPDYWRQYRESHPDYTAKNRQQQKTRNARKRGRSAAVTNSDASITGLPVSGYFKLVEIRGDPSGPTREWLVKLTLLAAADGA